MVGGSSPHRLAWVRDQHSFGVVLWCGAFGARRGPSRTFAFARMVPPSQHASLCHAVCVRYVLLGYHWGRGLVSLLPAGVVNLSGFSSDRHAWSCGSCRLGFPALRVVHLPDLPSSFM